jgi:hypothetical protein
VNVLWYATRATGEVALLFLTIVLALGALSAVRVGGRRVPRFVVAGMHRNLTLAGLGFLAVHILTTLLDSYAPIGLIDTVVPFVSAYRPIWLGLGAVAFDTLLVLTVTSLLRTRLNLRWWRAAHWSAYGCWLVAVIHAFGTGSDTRTSVFLLLTGGCVAVALVALAWRLTAGGPGHELLRASTAMGAVFTMVVIGIWALLGPLAPGWASRSGTPPRLVAGAGSSEAPASSPSASRAPSASLHGRYTVYLDFTEPGRARFTGPGGEAGQLSLDGRTIALGTVDTPRLFTGGARADEEGRIVGVLRDATGGAVTVRITLSPTTGAGTLRVTPGFGAVADEDEEGGE